MPKIAELRVIDGQTWARVEINGDPGIITLWTEDEKKAAIRDYLLALPEDKETVERVARGICEEVSGPPDDMDAWEYDPAGPVNRQLKKAPLWTKQVDAAKAALAALTATGR